MATVRPSGAGDEAVGTAEVVNGATVLHAGNADTTAGVVTNTLELNDIADDVGDTIGSKIVANDGTGASTTDRVGVSGAVSNTPAYSASATQWIMRGGNVTDTIGGVASEVFATPGANHTGAVRDFVHEISGTRVLGSGGGTFDLHARPSTEITPNYTKGAAAGDALNFVAPSGAGDVATSDKEATTTRAVPGGLVYHYGAVGAPTATDYKSKETYES